MNIQDEGSITFWLRHTDADWATNDRGYSFGTVEASGSQYRVSGHRSSWQELQLPTAYTKV